MIVREFRPEVVPRRRARRFNPATIPAGGGAREGAAGLGSIATLAGGGLVAEQGAAALASVATLAGAGIASQQGGAALASSCTLAGTGQLGSALSGSAALASAATLAGAGLVAQRGAGALASVAILAGAGRVSLAGAAALGSSCTLAGAGQAGIPIRPLGWPPASLFFAMRRRRAAPVVLAPDFLSALMAYLKGLEAVGGALGTDPWGNIKVYLREAPPSTSYPVLMVNPISDTVLVTNSPTTSWRIRRFQYDVIATDEDDAATLADAAYSALSQVAPRLTYARGAEFLRYPIAPPTAMFGTLAGRGGRATWRTMFEIHHECGELY